MIEEFISYIQSIVIQYGALGVFLATLLEEIIVPIPSPLVPLTAGFLLLSIEESFLEITWQALFIVAFPVSLGITLGSLAVYGIGYLGGKPAIEKSKKWLGLGWKDLQKIENKLIRGRGDEITLFILRVIPSIPGVAISGFCGIVRYPLKTFAIVTLLGSFSRALLLGIIGWQAGEMYKVYSEAISRIENYLLILLLVWAVLFLSGLYFLKKGRR